MIKSSGVLFLYLNLLTILTLNSECVLAQMTDSNPLTNDSQLNDPLLEEELKDNLEQRDLEREAMEAQGNIPIQENFDVLQENQNLQQIPQLDTHSMSSPSGVDTSTSTPSSPSRSKNRFGSSRKQDDSRHHKQIQKSTRTKRIKSWNARDTQKGFLSASEEGEYFYSTSNLDSGEREYKDDTAKTKPKKSAYKKGLLFVASDGSYVYGNEESPLEGSASVRFSQLPPLPMERTIDTKEVITYEDIYGTTPLPVVLLDYDVWDLKNWGHWVVSIGTSFAMQSGNGRFVDTGEVAQERYTLYVLLNHLSFVYRFQYTPHPWFVPYVSAGIMPSLFIEQRDDNERNKTKFIPAAQGSGGLRLNVGRLDQYGAGAIDAEYGINNLWLDVEVRRVQGLGSVDGGVDISANLINLGLGFDF